MFQENNAGGTKLWTPIFRKIKTFSNFWTVSIQNSASWWFRCGLNMTEITWSSAGTIFYQRRNSHLEPDIY